MAEEGNGSGGTDAGSGAPRASGPLEDAPLSLDALLSLLADRHRRRLLEYLVDQPNGTGSIDELQRHLRDRDGASGGAEDVEIALVHVHLPMLADGNLLEYDVRSGEVRYRRHDRLERLLEVLGEFKEVDAAEED